MELGDGKISENMLFGGGLGAKVVFWDKQALNTPFLPFFVVFGLFTEYNILQKVICVLRLAALVRFI